MVDPCLCLSVMTMCTCSVASSWPSPVDTSAVLLWCMLQGKLTQLWTFHCTVKPVLRDCSRDRKMWSLETGGLKDKSDYIHCNSTHLRRTTYPELQPNHGLNQQALDMCDGRFVWEIKDSARGTVLGTYTARPVCWSGWISDSYCSLKPLCSGMGEVVPARTSPTLLPHPLALCCHYPVSKCCSASIVVTGTLRVNRLSCAATNNWPPISWLVKLCVNKLHLKYLSLRRGLYIVILSLLNVK